MVGHRSTGHVRSQDARGQRHAEVSSRAVRVVVVDGVFIVPGAVAVVGRAAADEEQTFVGQVDLADLHTRILCGPSTDRGLADRSLPGDVQVERTQARLIIADQDLAVGRIVEVVARLRVVLGDVVALDEIGGAGERHRTQVGRLDLQPLVDRVARRAGRRVRKREGTGEGVDVAARTQAADSTETALIPRRRGRAGIGAPDAQQRTGRRVDARTAEALVRRRQRVADP